MTDTELKKIAGKIAKCLPSRAGFVTPSETFKYVGIQT